VSFVRREYRRRSLPPAALVALLEGLEASGAELVCLQFGVDRERASAWGGTFCAALPDSISLAANARCIASLDLVITVDTATAHLVGAMARPGWVLLPWAADPRWLRDREDSPWYPTLTLFRQPAHGDWPGLVDRVLERFRDWRAAWPH
jgi:ADP-heptose:LPS heptosyltransferase